MSKYIFSELTLLHDYHYNYLILLFVSNTVSTHTLSFFIEFSHQLSIPMQKCMNFLFVHTKTCKSVLILHQSKKKTWKGQWILCFLTQNHAKTAFVVHQNNNPNKDMNHKYAEHYGFVCPVKFFPIILHLVLRPIHICHMNLSYANPWTTFFLHKNIV